MEQSEKNQLLDLLLGNIAKEAKEFAKTEIEKVKRDVGLELANMKTSAEELKNDIESVLQNCPKVVCLGTPEKPKKEITHKAFDKVIKVLTSAQRKEKNIMLVGGAGGGKTHLCSQIAKALGIEFYPMSVGMQTTKSDLIGFVNATGGYVTSPVRKAYEDGGLLLLDEFDAAHAGVVTILNSLLANGHASFPDKIVTKNEKFVCLVACNTYGNGANMDYVGRNRLDGATLDRFLTIDIDYDTKMEKRLTNNESWYNVIKKVRSNMEKFGIKKIVSPRASMDGADLLDAGFDVKEVVDMVLLKGCDDDIKNKMLKDVDLNVVRAVKLTQEDEKVFELEKQRDEEKVYDIVVTLSGNELSCSLLNEDEWSNNFYLKNEVLTHIDFDDVWSNNGVIISDCDKIKLTRKVKSPTVLDEFDCKKALNILKRIDDKCFIVGCDSYVGKNLKIVVDTKVDGVNENFVKTIELKKRG